MRTRRAFLALAGGFALVRPPSARGQEERIVTIGVLPFGTVSWEIETMRRSGFDAAHGFKAEVVKLASNQAARIAFQSGAVDTIVSDVLWAARLRGEGRAIRPRSGIDRYGALPCDVVAFADRASMAG